MKAIVASMAVVLALAATTMTADAKGCIKGAVVGGAVGHFAAHHGVLGAAAGCLYGRHRANQAARDHQQRSTTGSSSRNPPRY